MATIGFDGISIEEKVDVSKAKKDLFSSSSSSTGGDCCSIDKSNISRIVGNVSTSQTLFTGTLQDVKNDVKRALDDGVDILAPSCGVAPLSPITNIKAMVEARNEYFNI